MKIEKNRSDGNAVLIRGASTGIGGATAPALAGGDAMIAIGDMKRGDAVLLDECR